MNNVRNIKKMNIILTNSCLLHNNGISLTGINGKYWLQLTNCELLAD